MDRVVEEANPTNREACDFTQKMRDLSSTGGSHCGKIYFHKHPAQTVRQSARGKALGIAYVVVLCTSNCTTTRASSAAIRLKPASD